MCKTNRKIPSIFCLIFILSIFAFADTWQETSTSDFLTTGSSLDGTQVVSDSVQLAMKTGWLNSSPAWWDANYQYRKQININNTNAAALSDYQIKAANFIQNETELLGSWHFSEGTGNYSYDRSGICNNVQLGSTASSDANDPAWSASGKNGNALSFDGSDDYTDSTQLLGITGNKARTIELWFNPSDKQGRQDLFSFGSTSGGQMFNILYDFTDEGLYFGGYGNDASGSTNTITRNAWNHIVVTYDSTMVKVYINAGSSPDIFSAKSLNTANSTLFIGKSKENLGNYKGLIDEFRVYNRVLSYGEILSHYQPKVKPDYADVRFVNSAGTVLPYWMEKDGTFWIKVTGTDSIPVGLSFIYAYYGNASVVSSGSGSAVFEFFDDFEDGDLSGWFTESGTWSVANKYAEGTDGGNNNFLKASVFSPPTDYVAEFLSYSGTALDGGIVFRYQDSNNTYASICRNPNNDACIYQKNSGSWILKSSSSFGLNDTYWVKNKFVMSGNTFAAASTYMLNGSAVTAAFSWTDPAPAWTSGSFGLYDYTTSNGRIDDVFVRKYAATEPAVYAGYEAASTSMWTKRKPVTITNSGSVLSDFQLKVENPVYNETGLVGSWHFDCATIGSIANGTAYGFGDTSGNNYNGTASNPNGAGMAWTTGKPGGAIYLGGTDDCIDMGTQVDMTGSATGTWMAWVKPSAIGQVYENRQVYICWGNGGNRFGCDVHRGGSWVHGSSGPFTTTNYPAGSWYHIAVVWDGATGSHKIYVNGALDTTTPTTTGNISKESSTNLVVGARYTKTQDFFTGSIDEIRIYNRALLDTEVQALYEAKAKLNYSDIRFTNTSGLNLPYYMEKDGTFWVKVLGQNSIPAGQSDIYLYYGNTSAVDDSRQDYFVSSSAGLISGGKTYTFITPQWDYYIDSGGRLTNGFVREVIYGSTEATVGWPGDRDPIIKIDLGAVYQVFQYKIYCGGGGEGGILFPSTLTIDVSTDDINWTTAVSNTGYTDIEQWAVLNSSAVFARYVKFNVIRRGNWGTWTMLGELEVYQSESAASLPVVFGTEQNSYNALGTFTSCVKDTGGDNTVINSIAWTTTGAGAIAMQVRAANSNSGWTASSPAWEDVTVNPDSDISTIGRYIQYRATFSGSELTAEPLLADVTITYTLPIAPPADSVSCDKLANTWYSTAVFTFTNTAGFGAQIDKYYYAWDNTASYTFTLAEPVWDSLTPQLQNSSTSDGLWYFHYLPYSSTNTPGTAQDMGPFKFDGTPPAAPTLSVPAVNASISSQAASFSWQGASDTSGVSYFLLMDNFTTFAAPVITIPNLAGTSYALSGSGDEMLIGNSTYYWRVTAVDGAGNSVNSSYRKFTTSSSLPQVYNESTGESYAGLQDALANSLDGDSLVINDAVSYDENLIITSDILLSNAVISPAAGFAVTGQGLAGGEVLRNCVITSGGISGLALGENLTLFNPDPNETLVIENSRLVNCLIELGADITNCTLENCDLEVTSGYFINATAGDFHLAAAAVNAIDKGKNLSYEFAIDKDGIDRGIDVLDVDNFDSGGWDIGAYEFVLTSGYINNGSGTGGDGTVSYAVMASDPGTLAFYSIGSSIMLSRTFAISKTGTLDVNWSLSDDMDWLSMDTVSGSGAAGTDVTASVDITGLTAGAYSGNITVTAPGAENSPLSIPVTLEISADESEYVLVSCEPSGLSFSAEYGSTGEISGELTLSKNGSIDFNWTISDNAAWISVSPYAGASGSPVDITVTVNASGLTAGMHSAEITVTAPGALNSPLSIPVSIVIYETDAGSDSSQGNSSPDNSLPGGSSAGNSSTGNNSTGGTTAGSMPSKPLLQLPANGMTDVFPAPVLGWAGTGSSNTTYWLELGEDAEFSQMLVSKMMNSTIYQTAGVQYGKVYYWRVNALNGAGASDWSETYWFQMKSNGESTDNGGKVSGCFIKKIKDKK